MLDRRAVEARVEALGEFVAANEWEAATDYERLLWHDVLKACARGDEDSSTLAELALHSLKYRFPRT